MEVDQGVGMVAAEHTEEWQREEGYKRQASDFNKWGAIAKENGMRFYLHNEQWVFDRDPATGKILFDVWIEETDPDSLFFVLDLMQVAYRGLDPVAHLGVFLLAHPRAI